MKNKKGFTMVEALISMAIFVFVVVSILNAITHRMHSDKKTVGKNIAIQLAENRMEEYLKFPAQQIMQMQAVMPATIEDFIVLTEEKNLVYYQTDPDIKGQYKRTTRLVQEIDAGGNLTDMVRVTVTVEYRKLGNRYPASIVLTTLRGR